MRTLRVTAAPLCVALALAGCGGDKKSGFGPSPPSALRFVVADGVGAADVWSGPDPGNTGSAVATAASPGTHGYTLRGTLGPAAGTTAFASADLYYLVVVPPGASLYVDAVQRVSDGMYMTGHGYSGLMSYSQDLGARDDALGPPDGRCAHLPGGSGWWFIATADWIP